ncbi:hypothetical protein AB835_11040 [Candidatus Endobugula sertula]|uniref:Toxin CptA n=1 Tax=Candidatus Endobugula sertula TaxID=62101 RepID=A0A1D2QN64_9GAMM|nr:hypothetical protein AB835_11040 [Candidatus Endobugula sertula]
MLHTIVLLAILNANLATYAQLLLSLWVLTCLLIHTLFWCWQPIYQVRYLHRGWWLIVKGQADRRYLIVDCYFWSPFLLMLLVENGQGKRKLLPIVFDSCSVDGFRWLRVTTRLIIDASR